VKYRFTPPILPRRPKVVAIPAKSATCSGWNQPLIPVETRPV